MSTMITHKQNIAVFDHLRDNILEAGPDSPKYLAFEYCGIFDMFDLLSFPDVGLLEYIPTPGPNTQPGPPQTLPMGHVGKMKILIKWIRQVIKDNDGVFPNEAEWTSFTYSDFDEFRCNPDNHLSDVSQKAFSITCNHRATEGGTLSPNDQKWNYWKTRAIIEQAYTHDVSEVFDLSELFDENYISLTTNLNALDDNLESPTLFNLIPSNISTKSSVDKHSTTPSVIVESESTIVYDAAVSTTKEANVAIKSRVTLIRSDKAITPCVVEASGRLATELRMFADHVNDYSLNGGD